MSSDVQPPSAALADSISIPSVTFREGYGSVAFYELRCTFTVQHKAYTDVIFRRFSDFVTLHQKLSKAAPDLALPSLPPKKLFGNLDPEFISQRRKELQAYLVTLITCKDDRIARHEELLDFLPEAFGRHMFRSLGQVRFPATDTSALLKRRVTVCLAPDRKCLRFVDLSNSSNTPDEVMFNDIVGLKEVHNQKCTLVYLERSSSTGGPPAASAVVASSSSNATSTAQSELDEDLLVNPLYGNQAHGPSISTSLAAATASSRIPSPSASTAAVPGAAATPSVTSALRSPRASIKPIAMAPAPHSSSLPGTLSGSQSGARAPLLVQKTRSLVFECTEDRYRFSVLLQSFVTPHGRRQRDRYVRQTKATPDAATLANGGGDAATSTTATSSSSSSPSGGHARTPSKRGTDARKRSSTWAEPLISTRPRRGAVADPKADAAVVASEVAAASASTASTGGHHRQAPSSGGSRLPNVTEEQRSATANGHVSAGAGAAGGDGTRIVTSSAKRTGAPTEESDSGSDDGNDSDGSTSSSSASPPPPPTGNADSTDTVRSHRRGASTLTGKNPRATTSLDVEPTVTTTLSMVISTWNLARLPLPPDLATWLPFAGGGHALVVIGVQECPESQEEMITRVQRHLGETYYLIAHKALWEIRIYVFAHSMQLPPHSFTNVETASVATGIMGIMGNKGGVAVSLRIMHTPVCFVNCHLAPHQERTEQRNKMFHEILESLHLGLPGFDVAVQNDMLFWIGDLNYRINMQNQQVVRCAKKGQYAPLLEHDQLQLARSRDDAFGGFLEGGITFPPTYRYLIKKKPNKRDGNQSISSLGTLSDPLSPLAPNSPHSARHSRVNTAVGSPAGTDFLTTVPTATEAFAPLVVAITPATAADVASVTTRNRDDSITEAPPPPPRAADDPPPPPRAASDADFERSEYSEYGDEEDDEVTAASVLAATTAGLSESPPPPPPPLLSGMGSKGSAGTAGGVFASAVHSAYVHSADVGRDIEERLAQVLKRNDAAALAHHEHRVQDDWSMMQLRRTAVQRPTETTADFILSNEHFATDAAVSPPLSSPQSQSAKVPHKQPATAGQTALLSPPSSIRTKPLRASVTTDHRQSSATSGAPPGSLRRRRSVTPPARPPSTTRDSSNGSHANGAQQSAVNPRSFLVRQSTSHNLLAYDRQSLAALNANNPDAAHARAPSQGLVPIKTPHRPFSQKRSPAYCDRVLWRSVRSSDVQQLFYDSCDYTVSSDHTPVVAMFLLNFRALPPATAFVAPCEVFLSQLRATLVTGGTRSPAPSRHAPSSVTVGDIMGSASAQSIGSAGPDPGASGAMPSPVSVHAVPSASIAASAVAGGHAAGDAAHHVYASFWGPFLAEGSRGKRTAAYSLPSAEYAKGGVIGQWDNTSVPVLQSVYGSPEFIAREKLLFSIKDGNSIDGSDREVGQGFVSLEPATGVVEREANALSWDFECPILHKARTIGAFTGKITLQLYEASPQ